MTKLIFSVHPEVAGSEPSDRQRRRNDDRLRQRVRVDRGEDQRRRRQRRGVRSRGVVRLLGGPRLPLHAHRRAVGAVEAGTGQVVCLKGLLA